MNLEPAPVPNQAPPGPAPSQPPLGAAPVQNQQQFYVTREELAAFEIRIMQRMQEEFNDVTAVVRKNRTTPCQSSS